MKKTSIKDIAKLSGVSVATVSRVINDNGRFSEETREKVLAVIKETNYQMNFSAKSLRMNKSFSVGILVPDISNYFFSSVVQQIEAILFDQGYSTIICNTGRNLDKEMAYLNMLESKMVDGLIVISGADEFGFKYTNAENGIPYVCIDRQPKDKKDTIFISSNHYQGAFEATEALIHAGVKSPVIFMHSRQSSSAKERLKGFQDALKKNNIHYDPDVSKFTVDLQIHDYQKSIITFVNEVTTMDGIFAINDNIALELLNLLPTIGKKIPNDIKVIGFDDTPQCNYTVPKLSSVKQNIPKIAQITVDNLITIIKNPKQKKRITEIVPVELSLKDSI
ncbi:LacI family DNA-binding transcriptional regulator [Listeria monocytogenes]|uniref:LacI family transcriptional regulator n=1 Tax=Listeria monocytogenes serotype 1/2a TaxID=1906951 RepID=A0A9P2DPG3_LISMN|nr:LacI family DNA-binding transcriptional regulator [Listeria monocytogenes]EAF3073099.1 LacI family transcriptional regulator [Listeria monocytogenes serotype 1/2a]EAF5051853.1 LacI family transcriptional regulator [Listeria monocytogenes]EHP2890981.1 LacI family DNA-binding transcriptional regulator [Listeria monocytogenes]EJK1201210.1 LacI family DNA-binding transcriptional regulator [Listeria monocytogenes]EJK1204123.1 LacI family DNA-binding transcriptional regulator [Listeria monocytoge